MTKNRKPARTIFAVVSLVLAGWTVKLAAGQASTPAHRAGADKIAVAQNDIGGAVSGPNGPEAGVWVIAETSDLPTKFRKIVVTDDRGRFLVPDLPKANYKIWVRGYGLVDSTPIVSATGNTLALNAVPAPDARAAAQIYPANYWYSLLQVPPASEFPFLKPERNSAPRRGRYPAAM